jgi:hypothetical protein
VLAPLAIALIFFPLVVVRLIRRALPQTRLIGNIWLRWRAWRATRTLVAIARDIANIAADGAADNCVETVARESALAYRRPVLRRSGLLR